MCGQGHRLGCTWTGTKTRHRCSTLGESGVRRGVSRRWDVAEGHGSEWIWGETRSKRSQQRGGTWKKIEKKRDREATNNEDWPPESLTLWLHPIISCLAKCTAWNRNSVRKIKKCRRLLWRYVELQYQDSPAGADELCSMQLICEDYTTSHV